MKKIFFILSLCLAVTVARADMALIDSISEEHEGAAEKLIKAGAKVNELDEEGNSALLYAVSLNSLGLSKLLIQKGADLKLKYGPKKENILFECARHDGKLIATLVIKKDKSLLKDVNTDEETPLFEAARMGSSQLMAFLVAQGMPTDIKNKAGKTALQVAQEVGFADSIKALQTKSVPSTHKTK